MKTWLISSLLIATSGAAVAAAPQNPISVHVLNTQTGKPAAGVEVLLEKKTENGWQKLSDGKTAQTGRISELFPVGDTFSKGVYRVTFETGDYYRESGKGTFFPEVTIPFHVMDSTQHYHIPLLLSPYGYTTYRGS